MKSHILYEKPVKVHLDKYPAFHATEIDFKQSYYQENESISDIHTRLLLEKVQLQPLLYEHRKR